MCGIAGMAGDDIHQTDLRAFKDLMRISTLRGVDGTGIFQGSFDSRYKDEWFIEKSAMEVNAFFMFHKGKDGNQKLLNSTLDNVFIGHTRWATLGPWDDAGCHPYHKGDIVGVHNGTMTDFKYFSADKNDSELLYEDIATRGLKTVLEDANGDSAFALVFLDMPTRTLFFARNDERDLWSMSHEHRKVLYWASEPEFLTMVASRHELICSEPVQLPKEKIYSICLDDIKKDKDNQFMVEDFKVRPKPKYKSATIAEFQKNWNAIDWSQTANSNVTGNVASDDIHPFGIEVPDVPTVRLTKSQRKEQKRVARIARAKAMADKRKFGRNNVVTLSPVMKPLNHVCASCNHPLNFEERKLAEKVDIPGVGTLYECLPCGNLTKTLVNAAIHAN